MFDQLGKDMKVFECYETGRRFLPTLPVIARIDGKAFHTWTKGLEKPFDDDLMWVMEEVTKSLVKATNAKIGYTQSDEISLLFHSNNKESQIFFDGKIFKMTSVLASMTTAFFQKHLSELKDMMFHNIYPIEETSFIDERKLNLLKSKPIAIFDCRVWQMPNKDEVIRYFKWREADAVRNSIQALGQANFSHKQLHGKNQNEIQDMLFKEKDINWNDYTSSEKRGTYFRKVKVFRRFSEEELKNLPPKHNARKDPKLLIERSDVIREYFPIFTKIKNQEEVLFDGKDPVT